MLRLLRSLASTAVFIALLFASLAILVFGTAIMDMLALYIPRLATSLTFAFSLRELLFALILTLFFSIAYKAVSPSRARAGKAPASFREHLPGAFAAAVGWMTYSFFYSLYIDYFPRRSYIYGSLTAVVFLLLWIYFCAVIFLLGAEINKLFFSRRNKSREKSASKQM